MLTGADHLRSGVGDQPGQYGETLSLIKIQKIIIIISQAQWFQILGSLKQENRLNNNNKKGGVLNNLSDRDEIILQFKPKISRVEWNVPVVPAT